MYKRKLTLREVPNIPLISNRTDIPSCLNQKLSLYRQGNALIHCSNGDKKFFEQKLPLICHQLVILCLNPRHEKVLTQIRGRAYGSQLDFVYVGNNNFANFIAVKWLLTEVFPLLNEPPPRIAFVGRIKELVEAHPVVPGSPICGMRMPCGGRLRRAREGIEWLRAIGVSTVPRRPKGRRTATGMPTSGSRHPKTGDPAPFQIWPATPIC